MLKLSTIWTRSFSFQATFMVNKNNYRDVDIAVLKPFKINKEDIVLIFENLLFPQCNIFFFSSVFRPFWFLIATNRKKPIVAFHTCQEQLPTTCGEVPFLPLAKRKTILKSSTYGKIHKHVHTFKNTRDIHSFFNVSLCVHVNIYTNKTKSI